MSEEKPIFSHSSESVRAEKDELRQKTKRNLDAEKHWRQANNAAVEQKIICASCQTESSAQANFCRVCGNNLIIQLQSPPTESNNIESPMETVEQTNLYWGTYAQPVSRRLPPPLDKLNTGQCAAIFEKFTTSSRHILLFLSHPLLTASGRYPYGLEPVRAFEQNGEYFIQLTNQIGPIDDPPMEDFEYPPHTIVKFDREEEALEILSPQIFLEVVAVMQKKIDQGGSSSFEDRNEELAFAFNLLK